MQGATCTENNGQIKLYKNTYKISQTLQKATGVDPASITMSDNILIYYASLQKDIRQ